MPKTIYPRDEDNIYTDRCPNIRIGFVQSVYKEIKSAHQQSAVDGHALYMRDVGNLLWQLPRPYRVLLFHIGAKIVLNKDHRALATCSYKHRQIRINVQYLSGFSFEGKSITGSPRAARLSYSSLFEETAHYLVAWMRYHWRPGFQAAMRQEIAQLSPVQRRIMRLEREYNAAGDEIKGGIEHYSHAHQPEELLIDLLRIRNYLAVQGIPKKTVSAFMETHFPLSWPYAKEFDRMVAESARVVLQSRRRASTFERFRPHGANRKNARDAKRTVRQALRQAA
jgi:hypothetical protein